MSGKGDTRRKGDDAVKYRENYDRIFGGGLINHEHYKEIVKAEGKPMEPFDCDLVTIAVESKPKKPAIIEIGEDLLEALMSKDTGEIDEITSWNGVEIQSNKEK